MKDNQISGANKTILAIGAHPDDIDFGCSGTLAKLAADGAEIYYVVVTRGNRGSRGNVIDSNELVKQRELEQKAAADIIGAKEIFFLNQEDGNLIADILLKEQIVKLIRKLKPDIVFTHDPSWIYAHDKDYTFINHNDHRQTGIATLDALYPLARDLSSFPEHTDEGITPHTVKEVYLFMTRQPNFFVDITDSIDKKIASINAHVSQIDHPQETEDRVRGWAIEAGEKGNLPLAEGFAKLILR